MVDSFIFKILDLYKKYPELMEQYGKLLIGVLFLMIVTYRLLKKYLNKHLLKKGKELTKKHLTKRK